MGGGDVRDMDGGEVERERGMIMEKYGAQELGRKGGN